MPLEFTASGSPSARVDSVTFPDASHISGTFLARIDEVTSGNEFFMWVGDGGIATDGVGIGVNTGTNRLYFWPVLENNSVSNVGSDNQQEMQLGKWHRISWYLEDLGATVEAGYMIDGSATKVYTVTGATRVNLSGWNRIAFGNRHDSTPNNYIDGMIQDAGIFTGAAATQAACEARHAALYASGNHKFITDHDFAETPFANWRLNDRAGTPTASTGGLRDEQGTYHLDTLSAGGLSYNNEEARKVRNGYSFGRVRRSHFGRLFGAGTSRRLLCIGDSHMYNGTSDRYIEGIMRNWPIHDWTSRTVGPRSSLAASTGGTIVSLTASLTYETEFRPGEVALALDNTTTNRWGMGTEYKFSANLTSGLFTLRLTDYADGATYYGFAGAPQWFNGVKYGGRPILYYDNGTSGTMVTGIRTKAARAGSTGSFNTIAFSGDGWQNIAIQSGSGSVLTADAPIDISVTGDGSHPTLNKVIFCHGGQMCVLEDDNTTPAAGFGVDTFSPFGMDTDDHEQGSAGAGSMWYTDAHAESFLAATRLRSDEHMILHILLSHEIPTRTKAAVKASYQKVIDRWVTMCENQGYRNPDVWLIGAWMVDSNNPSSMDEEREMLEELALENKNVSWISLSAYQQHIVHSGVWPSATDYLDATNLHWDTVAGTDFFATEIYDCFVASLYDDAPSTAAHNFFRRNNYLRL